MKQKKQTIIEKVNDLVDKYLDTTSAILTDYIADPGMELELGQADVDLQKGIQALEPDPDKAFDDIIDRLTDMDVDIDADRLLGVLDDDQVRAYLKGKGYAIIKVDNLAQQDKLTEFVEKEIWPNYNDRLNFDI